MIDLYMFVLYNYLQSLLRKERNYICAIFYNHINFLIIIDIVCTYIFRLLFGLSFHSLKLSFNMPCKLGLLTTSSVRFFNIWDNLFHL